MASGTPFPLAYAIKAVKTGLSARGGLRAFRAGGGKITDATWYRTVAEVRRNLANSLAQATAPLNRRPKGDEITVVSTAKSRGYSQQISVFVKDVETGEVAARPFSLRGRGLLTRQAAVNAAIEAFQTGVIGSPDRFNEVILGAAYENTIEYQPRE